MRAIDRNNLVSDLLLSAQNFALAKQPPWSLPSPEDLTATAAKLGDAEAILHASGTSESDSAMLLATRQYYALLKKNSHLEGSTSDEERKEACFDKFRRAQVHNRITVRRLTYYLRRPSRMPASVAELLGSAQLDIFRLLGPEPVIGDWKKFMRAKVFSTGTIQGLANYKRPDTDEITRYKDTTAYGKLSSDTTITSTQQCLQTFGRYLCNGEYGKSILSGHQTGELVECSEGTTVPKDAVVDRFIAIEPMLNAQAQQGILAMFIPYLRKWGITLKLQERNRELAQKASVAGCNASGWSTIDLSSASDTIVYPLVEYLLPKKWLELLDAARTRGVALNGEEVEGYESYCTMGNAFTFPLQCLIFASLTRAAIKACQSDVRDYRVYGDDIIVSSSASLLLLEALRFVGFKPNVQKSFVTGFFRESCGGDFLNGDDVTPVELDKDVLLATTKHILFNHLQRRLPEHPVLDLLYNSCKKPFVGPAMDRAGISEAYFEAPEFIMHSKKQRWYDYKCQSIKYRVPGLVPVSRKVRKTDHTRAYLSALLGAWGERHDLRGSQRYHVRSIVVDVTWRLQRYAPFWYAKA